jgi:hypothetical protein
MRNCELQRSFYGETARSDPGLQEYYGNIWLHAHRSILRFTSALPPAQRLRVNAESLVGQPDEHLPSLLSWLGIRCEPRYVDLMKHPEAWPFAHNRTALPHDCDSSFLGDPQLRKIPHPPPLATTGDWGLSRPLAAALMETGAALGYS